MSTTPKYIRHRMPGKTATPLAVDGFRRRMLMVIIVLGILGTVVGTYVMTQRGLLSPALLGMQIVTGVVLCALFAGAWTRWVPQRAIELGCLAYMIAVCAACMVLRMYVPKYGAMLDLEPLYLWFPVLYVFVFVVTGHKTGLALALGILLLFVLISVPFLVADPHAPDANITLQMHVVSAAMVATLYFFSGYQHRLRLAQLTMEELAQLSSTDDLTGLANRRYMATTIDVELARHPGAAAGCAVVLFDIDGFKGVNDRFGHGAGDAALVALAECAIAVFRDVDVVGRWGGDEFVALLRGVDVARALQMADALRARVAANPLAGGHPITISCGVTVARPGDGIDALLQRADAALYVAKRGGRNRVEGGAQPKAVHDTGAGA